LEVWGTLDQGIKFNFLTTLHGHSIVPVVIFPMFLLIRLCAVSLLECWLSSSLSMLQYFDQPVIYWATPLATITNYYTLV